MDAGRAALAGERRRRARPARERAGGDRARATGRAWRLAASNLDGGVGSSVSLAFVDEAWRVSRDVVDGSIAPTMLERRSPQLILVSTAGDGGSTLLLEDRDAAIAQLAEPEDGADSPARVVGAARGLPRRSRRVAAGLAALDARRGWRRSSTRTRRAPSPIGAGSI